jgi:hypothetical protein
MTQRPKVALVILTAFVVLAGLPSTAAALNDPDLTFPTGTMLGIGSKFKATNVGNGLKFTDTSGNAIWECPVTALTGTLGKNNGSEIEADIESFAVSGTAFDGRCTTTGFMPETHLIVNPATNGLSWCLRSTPTMKDDEFQIRGGACSSAARPIRIVWLTTFTGKEPVAIECVYERTGTITGTYKTHPEDAILTFADAEWVLKSGGMFCGLAWKLDMSFTLERDEATASPLYLS